MKSFRQIMICILCIFMLTACSKPAKSISMTDAFGYLSAEKYKEAAEAFTSIIAENPDSMEAYSGRGDAYAYSGEYLLAVADYTKAYQISENNVLYLLKNAVIYNLIDENEEAENNLKKVIELSGGSISSLVSSETTELITKLKAEESSKAVLDFIKTAAKESETAAVPTPTPAAAETPKADSTPTPAATQETKPTPTPAATATPKAASTPSSSSSTIPSDFKGTLADIKNLKELMECIAYMTAPMYGEMNSDFKIISDNPPYEPYEEYRTVNRFKTVDEYRNYYKKYMTDEMAKKMIRLSYRFAERNGKLYSLSVGIGFGGMSDKAKLVKVDSNGDYIIRISYFLNVTDKIDHSDDYRLRYVNGKFIIADLVPDKLNKSSGYAVVKTNHLNVRKKASTSAEKLGRVNTGAILDVYEIKKDGKYTWYKIGADFGYYNYFSFGWIADNGGWVNYVPYK